MTTVQRDGLFGSDQNFLVNWAPPSRRGQRSESAAIEPGAKVSEGCIGVSR